MRTIFKKYFYSVWLVLKGLLSLLPWSFLIYMHSVSFTLLLINTTLQKKWQYIFKWKILFVTLGRFIWICRLWSHWDLPDLHSISAHFLRSIYGLYAVRSVRPFVLPFIGLFGFRLKFFGKGSFWWSCSLINLKHSTHIPYYKLWLGWRVVSLALITHLLISI